MISYLYMKALYNQFFLISFLSQQLDQIVIVSILILICFSISLSSTLISLQRAGRSHSPMSECSRTTNTSRISLAKRAIHNSHRHNSDDQSQLGETYPQIIGFLSHILTLKKRMGDFLSNINNVLLHEARQSFHAFSQHVHNSQAFIF